MILDSFDHAEEDFTKRLLIEARNEAETILGAVERAPENPAWKQLTASEQKVIGLARDYLVKAKQTEDSGAIREATLILDRATRRFAELMMEAAVSTRHTRQDHGCSRRGTQRTSDCAALNGSCGV